MSKLNNRPLIRMIHAPIMALGPGVRIGVWFQGCPLHCEGCIAAEFQPFDDAFSLEEDEIKERISRLITPEIDGATISGGEPFAQPKTLFVLVKWLNSHEISDILIYSGYQREEIEKIENANGTKILANISALIDGRFERGHETKSTWKGSENQTLSIFRPEFQKRYEEWSRNGETKSRLQIVRNSDYEMMLVGIPKQHDVPELKRRLTERCRL